MAIPSYLKFLQPSPFKLCGEKRPPPRAGTESAPNPPRVCAPAQWRLQVPKPPPPQRPRHKNINHTTNDKKTYKKLVAHPERNITKETCDGKRHLHTRLPFTLLTLSSIDRNDGSSQFLFPQIVNSTAGKTCLQVTADLEKGRRLCCFPSRNSHSLRRDGSPHSRILVPTLNTDFSK